MDNHFSAPDPLNVSGQAHSTVLRQWRKAERERLIDKRLQMPAEERRQHANAIAQRLDQIIGALEGRIISLYWPFRGEPDLLPWLASVNRRGGVTALPLVVAKGQPLKFRRYLSGDPLTKGVWNIPVPATDTELIPQVVVAPIVGVDPGNYRLGYGGGFFDRTLATMPEKPLIIGVGYELQRIDTIQPQWHDVPMDVVVTEVGQT